VVAVAELVVRSEVADVVTGVVVVGEVSVRVEGSGGVEASRRAR